MSSVAAELSLRRRLLNRTAVFVLGALAFVAVAGRYPPLEIDGVLIFGGVLFFVDPIRSFAGQRGHGPRTLAS
jgi:hypothetical protein